MSAEHRVKLEAAAARLDEISKLLAAGDTDDPAAVVLAREAAEIAADVGSVAAEAAQAASESSDGS